MTPHDTTVGSTGRRSLAALAILASAVSYSLAPVVVHTTAADSNPFYFNSFFIVVHLSIFGVFLVLTKRVFVGDSITEDAPKLSDIKLWTSYLRISKSRGAEQCSISYPGAANHKGVTSWLRLPLVWSFLSGFTFVPFVLASQLVETAIASTVTELWPAFLVYGLVLQERKDRLYRNPTRSINVSKARASNEQVILTILAGLGLSFMLISQTGDNLSSPLDLLTLKATMGIVLALGAAVLAALGALGGLQLGTVVFYRLIDESTLHSPHGLKHPGDREPRDRRLLLWLTVLGTLISRIVTLPVSLVLGFSMSGGFDGLTWLVAVGGILVGVTGTAGSILLRVGNIDSDNPAVNALFFLSPLMALTWLMVAGITLPRFDLFIVGAALIVAINILIQLKPDQERDYSEFGKEDLPGTRLGFTSFIMSIWVFGTVVYLRDEVMPDSWLKWPGGEYWGLIALSATVFALILGFRVARLSTRISHEDEMMFGLFRDCEHLMKRGVLGDGTVRKLSDLDTAQPEELLRAYNEVRHDVRSAIRDVDDREDSQSLVSVAAQLDGLVHSKQQGRDIVELLSLTAFAIVTIGLGLLARPSGLDAPDASWSGFMSEVFILLFVSTVSFLCVNLFDIRRERETPLLVPVNDFGGDYRLFFRYKRDLTIQHVTAVLISVAMSVTFCVLLYGKWL